MNRKILPVLSFVYVKQLFVCLAPLRALILIVGLVTGLADKSNEWLSFIVGKAGYESEYYSCSLQYWISLAIPRI